MVGGGEALDVTGELGDDELQRLFDALDAGEYTVADGILDTAEARAAERGDGGNAATLRAYWLTGAGGRAIRWGTHGDFARCVEYVGKYMPGRANGYCAKLHHERTGYWPGRKLDKGQTGEEPAKKKKRGRIKTLIRKALQKVGVKVGEAAVEALVDAAVELGGDEERAAESIVADYIREEHSVSGTATAEASIGGMRSFADVEALVRAALSERRRAETGRGWAYIHVSDLTAGEVV